MHDGHRKERIPTAQQVVTHLLSYSCPTESLYFLYKKGSNYTREQNAKEQNSPRSDHHGPGKQAVHGAGGRHLLFNSHIYRWVTSAPTGRGWQRRAQCCAPHCRAPRHAAPRCSPPSYPRSPHPPPPRARAHARAPQLTEAHDEVIAAILKPIKEAWREVKEDSVFERLLAFVHAIDWKVKIWVTYLCDFGADGMGNARAAINEAAVAHGRRRAPAPRCDSHRDPNRSAWRSLLTA